MELRSISHLLKELGTLEHKQVLEICARLAKHKKENKELLSYLLFDSVDENSFRENIKKEIDELFANINRSSAYTTKKGLQKTVRVMNRYLNFSEEKQTELEIRLYFCSKVKKVRIDLDSSAVISNIYYREIDKIKTVFSKLHEDLQFDYKEAIEKLWLTFYFNHIET